MRMTLKRCISEALLRMTTSSCGISRRFTSSPISKIAPDWWDYTTLEPDLLRDAARLTAVDRVVFCSSSTVYLGAKDRPPSGLLEENFALQAVRQHPPSVYASMKLAGEWLGHNYREEYGVECASVRFAGVFGPWHGTPSGGP